MIQKQNIPDYVLLDLIAGIDEEAIKAVQDGEEECYFEVESGNWYFAGTATLFTEEVDDSYSHEFGTEYCSHLEYKGIDDIDMDTAVFITDDEDEIPVEMDYKRLYKLESEGNVEKLMQDPQIVKQRMKKINLIAERLWVR